MGTPTAVRTSTHASRRRLVAGVAGAVLLAGCTGSDSNNQDVAPAAASGEVEALEEAFQQVIDDVLPSVVEIRTTMGLGSGVVYNDEGYIVTNAHVVGTEQQFQVLSGTARSSAPRALFFSRAARHTQTYSHPAPRATAGLLPTQGVGVDARLHPNLPGLKYRLSQFS